MVSHLQSLFGRQDDPKEAQQQKKQFEGISFQAFIASLATALAIFGIEFLFFYIFKSRFSRIYAPRTYLVPERERTTTSNEGFFKWVVPVFRTSNSEFIQKCGLDAYLFLRYLRMLLKMFIPLAVVILPVLLPVNKTASDFAHGMDRYGWANIRPESVERLWVHLCLAIIAIFYIFWVFYDELRKYIRLRQAFLTSPQHRLRASATTVLVQGIPRKWLSLRALDELFDVFPGGVRNIWLNRDFEELADKVKDRQKLVKSLEAAETALIKKACEAKAKKEKTSEGDPAISEPIGRRRGSAGMSLGDPHQIPHELHHSKAVEGEKPMLQAVAGKAIGEVKEGFQDVERGIKGAIGHLGLPFGSDRKPKTDEREPSPSRDILHHDKGAHHDDESPYARPETQTRRSEMAKSAPQEQHIPAWKFWKRRDSDDYNFQAPKPRALEDDMTPLNRASTVSGAEKDKSPVSRSPTAENARSGPRTYPKAYEINSAEDGPDAVWRRYLTDKDRETMRLPLFKARWFPAIPLIGKKVDAIYHCRKEIARLNVEIEIDQREPERFALMNSAFIQFNNQVAAHMACQAVAHHVPNHMAPRSVEIAPNDILWDSLSMKWWERYVRTGLVFIIVVVTTIFWAIPVSFTGALSQVDTLANKYSWLAWLAKLPVTVKSIIQGVGPAALLGILLALLPIVFRILARQVGKPTRMACELNVQAYYFGFLFIQVFFVVSVSTAITKLISTLADHPVQVTQTIAQSVSTAGNYFFNYMILQALTVSAGSLVQIGAVVVLFILGPILDSTARQKFARQTKLHEIKWGTFFPVYTNLACIGIVYSVIAPLVMVFNIITFSLFWIVYRYQTLYVHRNAVDTGGLLFPRAVNQLFVGVYMMELVLIGLFLLERNEQGQVAATPQAIIMIIMIPLTILYQVLLSRSFSPLYRYIPITMEDEAVIRDDEFARALDKRFALADEERPGDDLNDVLENRERAEYEEGRAAEEYEMSEMRRNRREGHDGDAPAKESSRFLSPNGTSWAQRRRASHSPTRTKDGSNTTADEAKGALQRSVTRRFSRQPTPKQANGAKRDIESQQTKKEAEEAAQQYLFEGFHDEIEDLNAEERDQLVRRAFQHEAVRANRPSIWIPHDEFGISNDEIRNTGKFAGHNIWISNEHTFLDEKNRVCFSRPPPDFDTREIMHL